MSLDKTTLKLLTAKDQYLEALWQNAGGFTFLSGGTVGYSLYRKRNGETSLLAEGLGSSLPYSGQFVTCEEDYLLKDQKLKLAHQSEPIPLRYPATDLQQTAKGLSLVQEIGGVDHLLRLVEGEFKSLHQSESFLRQITWHPQGNLVLALTWSRDELPWDSARLLLVDTEQGKHEVLSPPGLNAPCAEATFSPDGNFIAASFQTGEFFQIWLYRRRTQIWVQLSFEEREHAVPFRKSGQRCIGFIRDGMLIVLSNDKAFWRMDTLDYSGHGRPLDLPLSYMNSLAISSDGDILTFGAKLDLPLSPVIIRSSQGKFQIVEQGQRMALDKNIRVQRLTWSNAKGEMIHGLFYRDVSRKTPAPLIMPVHGGPTDAVHASWPSKAIAFVQQGYAVLYVNYRGSFGYGFSYHAALEGSYGELEVEDLIAGIHSLKASGWIDPKRVGLWGGGVASLTVLRALSLHPSHFSAGVAVFPILDLNFHLSRASLGERLELNWALGHKSSEEMERLSPKSYLADLQKPLAVFAGEKDPLFPRKLCEQLMDELESRRVPSWFCVYENEGRAFRETETYADYYAKVTSFFDRFLKFGNRE